MDLCLSLPPGGGEYMETGDAIIQRLRILSCLLPGPGEVCQPQALPPGCLLPQGMGPQEHLCDTSTFLGERSPLWAAEARTQSLILHSNKERWAQTVRREPWVAFLAELFTIPVISSKSCNLQASPGFIETEILPLLPCARSGKGKSGHDCLIPLCPPDRSENKIPGRQEP